MKRANAVHPSWFLPKTNVQVAAILRMADLLLADLERSPLTCLTPIQRGAIIEAFHEQSYFSLQIAWEKWDLNQPVTLRRDGKWQLKRDGKGHGE